MYLREDQDGVAIRPTTYASCSVGPGFEISARRPAILNVSRGFTQFLQENFDTAS
jgi:hypothetical protein